MPFQVKSSCPRCRGGDQIMIGNWPEHLGVFSCPTCRALVNVPLESETCPGCSHRPAIHELFDYSGSIPYLEGQFPGVLEPGPTCPRCSGARLRFETISHLSLGMVVFHPAAAGAAARFDHLERAIFERSILPVCEEMQIEPGDVFSYFHLELPAGRRLQGRPSYPMVVDIRTHLKVAMMTGSFTPGASSASSSSAPGALELSTPLGTLTFDLPADPVTPPAPAPPAPPAPPPAQARPAPAPQATAPTPPPVAQAPAEPPAVAALREKIEICLIQSELNFRMDGERYILRKGSTLVFVRPAEWSGRTVVQLFAPVAVDCRSITGELALRLAEKNSELVFGKFSIDRGRRMILFEHALLGDSLDSPELLQALIAVAATADQHDEEVSRLAGGQRMIEG